ncbi:hypothetical protein EYF80_051252 [Liparis tanakae]|uniref:Uncharacterized protein n=1 Tax=Liparis tanakae TaxID=230148 RepID=A0A4Z2FBM1_9TELE|nr:hypothetical protein EYF80_051252 [Liparis tanakae]
MTSPTNLQEGRGPLSNPGRTAEEMTQQVQVLPGASHMQQHRHLEDDHNHVRKTHNARGDTGKKGRQTLRVKLNRTLMASFKGPPEQSDHNHTDGRGHIDGDKAAEEYDVIVLSTHGTPAFCSTHLERELLVPEAPEAVLSALAVGGLRVQQRVGLAQLPATAPVVLQQLGQLVALLPGQSAELGGTHLNALQPRPQTSSGLPNTQLLQREGLQRNTPGGVTQSTSCKLGGEDSCSGSASTAGPFSLFFTSSWQSLIPGPSSSAGSEGHRAGYRAGALGALAI